MPEQRRRAIPTRPIGLAPNLRYYSCRQPTTNNLLSSFCKRPSRSPREGFLFGALQASITKKERLEWAYKPGFVVNGHFSGTTIARRLVEPTVRRPVRSQPTREFFTGRTGPRRDDFRRPCFSLLGFASGGVYQARPVTRPAGALLPHRFTLTSWETEVSPIGGMLSVALSLSSRTVGVTHHPVL